MKRRNAIAAVSGAFVPVAELGGQQKAPKFFTQAEYELLSRLCDVLIPADEASPGAGAAGAPWYIDRVVAQAGGPVKALWKAGLEAARRRGNAEEAMAEMARNEGAPQTEGERFFAAFKSLCLEAYLYSEGGRKYLGYTGSRAVPEFPGCELTPIPETPDRGRA